MRTVRSSPIVSTSPAFTAWPGAFSRTPLMRTWPASISAAALVRAFTTRACHNHLSRRWRSKQHQFENRPDARSACLEQHHSTNEIVDPEKTGTTLRDHGHSAPDHALERDNFSSNRHPVLSFCLSMIFSENRCPLFRIMLYRAPMIRSFLTVSAGTLASRLLGFARDSIIAALLGAGTVADAFLVAFQLVNVVRRLLTEGALNAALVPAWLRVRETDGAAAAAAFAGRVLGTLSAALIVASLLIGLLMPFVITALAPGFAGS